MVGPWRDERWAGDLLEVLERARDLGFLGPGPVDPHVERSLACAAAVPAPEGLAVDLGTGAGVPGLVLALVWPSSRWVLLDSMERRTGPLREAVIRLGLGERVTVRTERAETAGRDAALRGASSLVVARSFAAPAVLAECAAPLLRVGGLLVVSEPPEEDPSRWPTAEVELVGLERAHSTEGWQVLEQRSTCPATYPRRTGVPAKRPLWRADR